MNPFRTETDSLGTVRIPGDALHGIHTHRALANFPLAGRPVRPALVRAYGAVKLACARTNRELGCWDTTRFAAIEQACSELMDGALVPHVTVDALQGGAGTSTNMNVNEVIANRALVLLSKPPGDYAVIHPLDDVNRHQSTNDTFPTALRVAAMWQLQELERRVTALLEAFQAKEHQFAYVVKLGRTELQDAVLTTLGRTMSAYAEAFGRDRWRVYKCGERLRVVNLGGTAIGTGLGAPRRFVFRAVEHLREITHLNLARAENLVEATQNTDAFVEVSGILKALAGNLVKVANDLRLLSSGPDAGFGEIRLPPRQAGSSIMPGKVNPVIPEAVVQAGVQAVANDAALTQACAAGCLELNPFMPLIADSLLGTIELLTNACGILAERCVEGIAADEARCREHVDSATATVTALVESIGYAAAQEAVALAAGQRGTVRDIVLDKRWLTAEQYNDLVSAETVTKLGSSPLATDRHGTAQS